MKNFIVHLKKLKDTDCIIKSEITGKPFFGEITIVINDGRIDRIKNYDMGEIIRVKENIKI